MIALWIVVGLVVLVGLALITTVVPRRRRALRDQVLEAPPLTPKEVPGTETSTGPSGGRSPVVEAPPRAPEDLAGSVAVEEREEEQPPGSEEVLAPPELRERMGRTRGLLSGYVRSLRSRGSVDEESWEELEEALLRADVGVATTTSLMKDLKARVRSGDLRGPDAVLQALRDDLRETLGEFDGASVGDSGVGGNGDGHGQTSPQARDREDLAGTEEGVAGSVARKQLASGRSVVLAAGDTFRAAAVEQLGTWGERAGVEVVRGGQGADPSAVVYDAVRRAAARGSDLVLADTAGRLHTKVNLVEELKKIRRVADRPPGHVTEVLLVLDATTGQNGLIQAREFLAAVGVTGVVLTKLDGTAKGGIVVAIQRELGLPVKLVGVGEGAEDLVPFDPAEFVDALFD
jgi:fused signal recognition particle receptor